MEDFLANVPASLDAGSTTTATPAPAASTPAASADSAQMVFKPKQNFTLSATGSAAADVFATLPKVTKIKTQEAAINSRSELDIFLDVQNGGDKTALTSELKAFRENKNYSTSIFTQLKSVATYKLNATPLGLSTQCWGTFDPQYKDKGFVNAKLDLSYSFDPDSVNLIKSADFDGSNEEFEMKVQAQKEKIAKYKNVIDWKAAYVVTLVNLQFDPVPRTKAEADAMKAADPALDYMEFEGSDKVFVYVRGEKQFSAKGNEKDPLYYTNKLQSLNKILAYLLGQSWATVKNTITNKLVEDFIITIASIVLSGQAGTFIAGAKWEQNKDFFNTYNTALRNFAKVSSENEIFKTGKTFPASFTLDFTTLSGKHLSIFKFGLDK